MNWFKHFTGYRNDPKVRILREEFGIVGAAVPIFMVEIVAESLGPANPEPFLTYSPRVWAEFVGMDVRKFSKVVARMQDINLFDVRVEDDGKITFGSDKILKYCDEYTKNLQRDGKIPQYKHRDKSRDISPDTSQDGYRVRKKDIKKERKILASATPDLEGQSPPHNDQIARQLREAASKIGNTEPSKSTTPTPHPAGNGEDQDPDFDGKVVKISRAIEDLVNPEPTREAVAVAWVNFKGGRATADDVALTLDNLGIKGHDRVKLYQVLGYQTFGE